MKLLLLLHVICIVIPGFAQQTYRCEYRQLAKFKLPDSSMRQLRTQLMGQGMGESMADQFVAQMTEQGVEQDFLITMNARPDTTFMEVNSTGSDDNVKVNRVDRKSMMTKGKIYVYDFSSNNWIDRPGDSVNRKFSKTGNTKKVFNYDCIEYLSADSIYRIWVAASLPSYINPGIPTDFIHGAVLAYEIKQKDQFVQCEISKLDH